jgi:hypothetical protein
VEHRYSEDQPRDPDGKFASGGGAPAAGTLKINGEETTVAKQAANLAGPNLDQKIAITYKVHAEAARQGVTKDWAAAHITVGFGEPPTLNLGGNTRQYGGAADLKNGQITLYPQSFGKWNAAEGKYDGFSREMGPVLAHEIEHERFEGVLQDYLKENDKLHDWASNDHELFDMVTHQSTGYLDTSKELAVKEFPVMTKLEPYLSEHSDQLYKNDGCTPYSTEWWDQWNHGQVMTKNAIHETLAEMSRLAYNNGGRVPVTHGIKDNWMQLHEHVANIAAAKGFGKTFDDYHREKEGK